MSGRDDEELKAEVLEIHDLSVRHYGVTKALGDSYTEAARVCLHRHHASPQTFQVDRELDRTVASVEWAPPTPRELAAHANNIDATEAGAYAMVLAGVELTDGLVAVHRAETRTGADYYLASVGSATNDLEDCIRLEVSGISRGETQDVKDRLGVKVRQAAKGKSALPAMAGVVGFSCRTMMIKNVGAKK
jgi:hypothetical protein